MIQTIPQTLDRFDPRRVVFQASDMAVADPFTTSVSGTNAAVTFATVVATGTFPNRYGFASLDTGTTTTGRANVITPTNDQILAGYGKISFCAMMRTPSNLSDGTNRYGIKIGIGNSNTTLTDSYGASFRYRDNINSGKWQLMTTDYAGSQTFTDSGITVAASTFYKFEIFISADGAKVEYLINGSRIAIIDTDLLDGTNVQMGLNAMILKALGTTSRVFLLDYMDFRMEVER